MEIGTLIRELGGGMWASAEIFILTLLFSLPLGLVVAFGRMSKIAPVRWISKLYISIMRGTPLMLQLMVVYFGPYYLFGMRISTGYRMTAVLIGFAINYAAYFAEIYRGGIEAIPVGQYEAAKVLGYSKSQTFFRIVFPQVCKHILPAVTNEIITLGKGHFTGICAGCNGDVYNGKTDCGGTDFHGSVYCSRYLLLCI